MKITIEHMVLMSAMNVLVVYRVVYLRNDRFKTARPLLEVDSHSGCTSTSVNERNITAVENLVRGQANNSSLNLHKSIIVGT